MVLPTAREQTVITEAYAKERGVSTLPFRGAWGSCAWPGFPGKGAAEEAHGAAQPQCFTRLEPFTKPRTTSIPLAPFCCSKIYQTPRHSLCLWQIQVNIAHLHEKQNSLAPLVELRLTKFSLVHLHQTTWVTFICRSSGLHGIGSYVPEKHNFSTIEHKAFSAEA